MELPVTGSGGQRGAPLVDQQHRAERLQPLQPGLAAGAVAEHKGRHLVALNPAAEPLQRLLRSEDQSCFDPAPVWIGADQSTFAEARI